MRIGITFDLKTPLGNGAAHLDDSQEEFDTPHTIDTIAGVIRDLGHDVVLLGDGRECVEKLLSTKLDFVFNYAEGHGVSRSREARIPAVLEMLGIPYTGSDPLTMAVTLDKDAAKTLVAAAGVKVPRGAVIEMEDEPRTGCCGHSEHDHSAIQIPSWPKLDKLRYPLIVKPAWEGSSKGIRNQCLIRSPGDLFCMVSELRESQRQPILVEEFIKGDEVTVAVIGNDPPEIFGVMRILPREKNDHFIYSLEVKRDYKRQVRYECPPSMPDETVERVREAALMAYRALGCRDVARIDFRVRAGVPYFLEVNPLPGLNPLDSDLVIMAQLVGVTHGQLIEKILESAVARNADNSVSCRAARMAD